MKVLYIAHSSELQGAGFALLNILRGMLDNNIEPVLFLPRKGPISEFADKEGIKCYFSHCRNAVYPKINTKRDYLLFPIRLLRILGCNYYGKKKLSKIVSIEKPDLIHSNTGVIHFGYEISKKYSIPHIWHIRELLDLGLGWQPIGGHKSYIRKLSDANNYCIAITKSVFEHHKLDAVKDVVIYDGVYDNKVCNSVVDYQKLDYFLFVGVLTKAKGVFDAIDAFCEIAKENPNIRLKLAGLDNEHVAEYVSKTSCKERIELLGFRKDIYTLMRKAKALIVPSFFEGFGFITAEAMANGCLVIGRDTAGTKEQFDNGNEFAGKEIGLRFNDKNGLIVQMRRAMNMSQLELTDLIDSAQIISRRYTIDNNTKNIIAYYKQVIEKQDKIIESCKREQE